MRRCQFIDNATSIAGGANMDVDIGTLASPGRNVFCLTTQPTTPVPRLTVPAPSDAGVNTGDTQPAHVVCVSLGTPTGLYARPTVLAYGNRWIAGNQDADAHGIMNQLEHSGHWNDEALHNALSGLSVARNLSVYVSATATNTVYFNDPNLFVPTSCSVTTPDPACCGALYTFPCNF